MGVPKTLARHACEARMARMRKRPMLFEYWDRIVENSESRLHTILGQTGSGKSTLALLYLADRYECDVDEIMARIVWRPDDFLDRYEQGGDVLVWDDAGIWYRLLARAHWDPLAVVLTTIYDIGRLQVPLVILTLVTDRDLPRGIRYNSFVYRSRTRVWKIGFDEDHGVHRAKAITQFRKEKADWSQSYWDASQEYVYKFYHFRRDDSFYQYYLEMRREYARFFLKYARERLRESRLYELLKQES